MKKNIITLTLLAASLTTAFATDLTVASSFSSTGNDIALQLTGHAGGDSTWTIGDTVTIEFDIAVTNPSLSGNGWLHFGIGDDNAAIGGAVDDTANNLVAGLDSAATGGGNFSISVFGAGGLTRDRTAYTFDAGSDLEETGEDAHIFFAITRTGTDDWATSFVLSNISGAATSQTFNSTFTDSLVTVGSITELLIRVNDGGGAGAAYEFTNISVSVVPEPGTYALLAGLTGLAFVMMRRRK